VDPGKLALVNVSKAALWQDVEGWVWDIPWMAYQAIKSALAGSDQLRYQLIRLADE